MIRQRIREVVVAQVAHQNFRQRVTVVNRVHQVAPLAFEPVRLPRGHGVVDGAEGVAQLVRHYHCGRQPGSRLEDIRPGSGY